MKKSLRTWHAIMVMFIISTALLPSSCKQVEYVPVIEKHTDSLYVTKVSVDSVFVRDSVFVNQYSRNDTVFREKELWKTAYKYKMLRDTVRIVKIDSIPVFKEVIKIKKERYVPPFVKVLAWIGAIVILAIIAFIFLKVKKIWSL